MANASWYCIDCGTHGGGPPNSMTIQDHIDAAHDGGIAQVYDGTYDEWKREQRFRE